MKRPPSAPARTPLAIALHRFAPVLLWMAVIFTLSTDIGSAAHTQPVVHGILYRLFANRLGPELTDRIDWDVRKCAHVTIYTILSLLIYRAVAMGSPKFRSRNILLTFLIGVLYAASDEYHQSFVASRGASAADVLMDSYGVLVGLVFSLWCLSLWRWCLKSAK